VTQGSNDKGWRSVGRKNFIKLSQFVLLLVVRFSGRCNKYQCWHRTKTVSQASPTMLALAAGNDISFAKNVLLEKAALSFIKLS